MYEEMEMMYLSCYGQLYKYIIKIGGNNEIADDIIQNTFLKAIKNIESFNKKSTLKTWLFSIAKYELYSYFRKNKITFKEISEEDKINNLDYTNKILSNEILKAVSKCKPPLNKIMTLRLVYGMSFKEIGDKVGKTENYCRVNFYRIKEKLRREYEYE